MPLVLRERQIVPMPTPTKVPTTWTLAYAHDYDIPDGLWLEQIDAGYSVRYLGGEYQLRVTSPHMMIASRPGLHYEHYAIEVSGRAASYPWGLYGILFGADHWGNGYLYRVDGAGRYSLRAKQGDEWHWMIPWTASPHVYGGITPNRLRVERVGDTIRLFANGYHLATVTDQRFAGHAEFGLTVSAQELAPVDVRFDRFWLYVPTDGRAVGSDLGGASPRALEGEHAPSGMVDVAVERD